MAGLDDSLKEEIKEANDIVEVVAEYVQLKRVGKNLQGLCPFHHEKTPSFTVNPEKQFYYCFGCGAGGDVIDFLMQIENISFYEALRELAGRAGITLLRDGENSFQNNDRREKLFKINELACKFYHYLLIKHTLGKKALIYLSQRGFKQETISYFQLGYAPERWDALLKFLQKKGFASEDVEEAGLAIRGKKGFYDRFRGRVIFPISNGRGQVIGFGGRVLQTGQQPKYLNSPQTSLFNKSKTLYGLFQSREEMRRKREAIIVEGYTDMISLYQGGFANTVASLGTSLTVEQAGILKRYVDRVYIAYDADTAGTKATLRGLEILREKGLKVRVVSLPEGTDPDQIIKNKGEFSKYLNNSLTLPEFKIKQIMQGRDLESIEEKVSVVRELIPVLANIDNAVERDLLLEKVSGLLHIPVFSLNEDLNRYINKKSKNKDRKAHKWNNKRRTVKIQVPDRALLEEEIIRLLLKYPELTETARNFLDACDFTSPKIKKIFSCIIQGKDFDYIYNFLDKGDKEILLKYTVIEDEISIQQADERLSDLINIIYQNRRLKKKQIILQKLEEGNGKGLGFLNKVLIDYHRLLVKGNCIPERGDIGGKGQPKDRREKERRIERRDNEADTEGQTTG